MLPPRRPAAFASAARSSGARDEFTFGSVIEMNTDNLKPVLGRVVTLLKHLPRISDYGKDLDVETVIQAPLFFYLLSSTCNNNFRSTNRKFLHLNPPYYPVSFIYFSLLLTLSNPNISAFSACFILIGTCALTRLNMCKEELPINSLAKGESIEEAMLGNFVSVGLDRRRKERRKATIGCRAGRRV